VAVIVTHYIKRTIRKEMSMMAKLGVIMVASLIDAIGVMAICGVVHKGLMTYTTGIIWANMLGGLVVSVLADSLGKVEGGD
jgi:hypothetical protein